MNQYLTTAAVHFAAGTLFFGLSDSQVATRSHLLTEIEDELYRAEQPVVFKAGEVIGLMTDPAKGETGLELVDADLSEFVFGSELIGSINDENLGEGGYEFKQPLYEVKLNSVSDEPKAPVDEVSQGETGEASKQPSDEVKLDSGGDEPKAPNDDESQGKTGEASKGPAEGDEKAKKSAASSKK